MQAKTVLGVILVAAIPAVSFFAAGQRSVASAANVAGVERPAVLEPVPGTDLHRVTLSARAAERLRIVTAPAVATRGRIAVPYAAVLYDVDGDAWVYTSPEPLVYVRHRVRVDYIDGTQAVLSEGPAPGTAVVTAGGAELLGAEYEGGH